MALFIPVAAIVFSLKNCEGYIRAILIKQLENEKLSRGAGRRSPPRSEPFLMLMVPALAASCVVEALRVQQCSAVRLANQRGSRQSDRHLNCLPAEIALQHSAHVLAQIDTIITEIDEVALIAVGCAAFVLASAVHFLFVIGSLCPFLDRLTCRLSMRKVFWQRWPALYCCT